MQLEAASSPPGVRADWDELRREARRIEGDLDVRLSSYAKLGVGYSDPKSPASDSHWKSMEMEIEMLLARLTDVNEAMSRCAAAAMPTTSVAQKLTRHRDILHEFAQEFKRTRGNIMSMREHAELLTSVRNDINEYKTSSSSQAVPNLLRERAAIHGSITQIDEVTSQAEAIKGVLSVQRSTFGEIQGKVKQLSDRFPVIRNLLGMIKRKKSKDTIILSAVIAGFLSRFRGPIHEEKALAGSQNKLLSTNKSRGQPEAVIVLVVYGSYKSISVQVYIDKKRMLDKIKDHKLNANTHFAVNGSAASTTIGSSSLSWRYRSETEDGELPAPIASPVFIVSEPKERIGLGRRESFSFGACLKGNRKREGKVLKQLQSKFEFGE
ncbi:hypothetical protein OPV22_032448 [Ensete ventricosum]|uniref:Golgi SNAP receptor complex member 1 n=1 Tax=Ensete ventricosum TaxID=4639 RepID=A0AAV8PWM2_ENSVE|nr:hypothetical protein OPV22_032448 [Ensete ventricosum]